MAETKIVMVGLESSGKTTILNKLNIGEVVTTEPTLGFIMESVHYANVDFHVWDVGGESQFRPLWKQWYENARALIFVVDSSDRERMFKAYQELHMLLDDETLKDAVVMVYANKQDLDTAMSAGEVARRLGITSEGREWFIMAVDACSGNGLWDGLGWVHDQLKIRLDMSTTDF